MSRRFSELRAAIVADPVRAARLRRVSAAVRRAYEAAQGVRRDDQV